MRPLLAIVAVLLTGGTISPTVDDARHVEYGEKFHHVAYLRCETEKTQDNPAGIYSGSCVVISPNHVLTAAHVVINTTAWTVTTDDGKSRTLSRVSIHPSHGKGGGLHDLAVGFTDDKFEFGWYPAIYSKSDEEGKVVSIAGYGMTGNFRDGITGGGGKRRAGSNKIDFATGDYLICSIVGPHWTSLEFMICAGDSGGGLFIGNELAGINSCIMSSAGKPKAKYGEESVHVRLSEPIHRDWILEELRRVD